MVFLISMVFYRKYLVDDGKPEGLYTSWGDWIELWWYSIIFWCMILVERSIKKEERNKLILGIFRSKNSPFSAEIGKLIKIREVLKIEWLLSWEESSNPEKFINGSALSWRYGWLGKTLWITAIQMAFVLHKENEQGVGNGSPNPSSTLKRLYCVHSASRSKIGEKLWLHPRLNLWLF